MAADNGPLRVLLWSSPRSCATLFLRSMSHIEGGAFYHEPYANAFYFGPERVPSVYDVLIQPDHLDMPGMNLAYDSSVNTFSWTKQTLERGHNDAELVFVKDIPFCLQGQWGRLPDGFRHTFLIRNPGKMIPSWRKMNEQYRPTELKDEDQIEEWHEKSIEEFGGYKELLELYEYVKHTLDPNPFVLDADDLLADPEAMLMAYCKATGIPFSQKLLEWEDDGKALANIISCRDQLMLFQLDHHTNAVGSRGLLRDSKQVIKPPSSSPVTNPTVAKIVERCLPYYQKLYKHRYRSFQY